MLDLLEMSGNIEDELAWPLHTQLISLSCPVCRHLPQVGMSAGAFVTRGRGGVPVAARSGETEIQDETPSGVYTYW